MSRSRPIDTVISQLKAAKPELDLYPPAGFHWYKRSIETANQLVPWLTEFAPELKAFVEEVANSKQLVRDTWMRIKSLTAKSIPPALLQMMDRELDREAVLLATVGGDVLSKDRSINYCCSETRQEFRRPTFRKSWRLSLRHKSDTYCSNDPKVIENFLIENFPGGHLESNGRSDYPDLFLRTKNYEGLPTFARLNDKTKDYGAALKGSTRRPVRVPDGLEIKTCKSRFAVDCRHAHAGLHLALVFHDRASSMEVSDIKIAFLRYDDYRITKPASPTTTLKASFNANRFVSLFVESD